MSSGPAWGSADDVDDDVDNLGEAAIEAVYVVPTPPLTGDAEVDHATAEVAGWSAAQGTLEEQLSGYEAAHRILQARLADVEG